MIHVLRRMMTVRRIPSLPQANELECLREIRLEMNASYPRIRVLRIARILRKFRVKRLPAGLLIDKASTSAGLLTLFKAQIPRLVRKTEWHPLFDPGAYLALYPDVAASRATPWLHYQVFGRVEARTPHPFIDVKLLSASMVGVPIGEVVDRYLTLPEMWTVDSSNYVDCQRFLLSGHWDGRSHPLVQLTTTQLQGPWIHHRLMLTDTTVDDLTAARGIAVATLLAKAGGAHQMCEIKLWREDLDESRDGLGAGLYTVIPGFFLGKNDSALAANPTQMLSDDASIIRLSGEFIGRVVGPVRKIQQLVYLRGSLSRESLRELLSGSPGSTVIAPASSQQQLAAQLLIEDLGFSTAHVLEVGSQTRVQVDTVSIVPDEILSLALCDFAASPALDATTVALVLPVARGKDIADDVALMPMIRAGALLCLSHDDGVAEWMPLLKNREFVLVDETMISAVRGLVDDASLRILPATIRRGES